jgi:hypothetical protein
LVQSDLLIVLAYLDPVFKDDDGLRSQLTKQLKSITDNINAFGKESFEVRHILLTLPKSQGVSAGELFGSFRLYWQI